jgi:hypothetical protein
MPAITISGTASELISRNRLRKSLVFQNEDSTISAFIKRERTTTPTVSTTDHDHRLAPGGALALNFGTDGTEAIQDRWTIVAASGTPIISYFETEEVVR